MLSSLPLPPQPPLPTPKTWMNGYFIHEQDPLIRGCFPGGGGDILSSSGCMNLLAVRQGRWGGRGLWVVDVNKRFPVVVMESRVVVISVDPILVSRNLL